MRKLLYLLILCSSVAHAQTDTSHHVPANKSLSKEWKVSLYNNERKPLSGDQLKTIGMPCGGIASGQLYVRGDGTLAGWWIANNAYNTGYGAANLMNFNTPLGPWKVCYQTFTPVSYIDQGFSITTRNKTRQLNKQDFKDIEFTGEYPIATIAYKDNDDPLPLKITMQVYSPFIPLNARESATPGTIMTYTLTNTLKTNQVVTLAGHLQNLVGLDGKDKYSGTSRNRIYKEKGLTGLQMDLVRSTLPVMHPWNGNVSLSLISDNAFGQAETGKDAAAAEKPLGDPLTGTVGTTINLKPGETRQLTFLLTWYFPNRPLYIDVTWNKPLSVEGNLIGNNYANWFDNSVSVARWLRDNLTRLHNETFAFHDAYYNGTLPYWLSRRLLAPMSTLATETCQWWGTGKFYAWEGVGSCVGTCTHVWNYEQGLAHLFPELERNIREQTDFADSFNPDGGILTRNGDGGVAIDGQAGTVLKAYREHLLSKDYIFLNRNWDKIKKATQFLVRMDGNADGLIDGIQPNTYDISFFGANTYVGSLYLAALKASAAMAAQVGDNRFADSCTSIAKKGSFNTSKKLYNGKYFIQDVNLKEHPVSQYGKGCLADQLFGQTWAYLYDLGYLYPKQEVRSALESIWKYNWASDVSVQTAHHTPERDYADAGEAGLLICTWPDSPHPGEKGVRYRDEVWTGIEYQVATSMISEDMVEEGLSIIKGLDGRYQPEKHNPWNEIECGDHYARAMASWGVLLALEGFTYNGPEEVIGFSPKIQQANFKGFFSADNSWGTISQTMEKDVQTNSISLSYGHLNLKTVALTVPESVNQVTLNIDGKNIPFKIRKENGKTYLDFAESTVNKGETLIIQFKKTG